MTDDERAMVAAAVSVLEDDPDEHDVAQALDMLRALLYGL